MAAGLQGYRRLLADRTVRTVYVASFFARMPAMAAPIVFTLYVVGHLHGNYAQAGIVAAADTVGTALGAPWRGRRIDALGMRRAVVPSIVAVALLYPLALTVPSWVWLVPVAFAMGVFMVPIFSIIRVSLSVLVPEEDRRTAFALDGVMAEMSFLVGPAAGAALITQANPLAAIAAIGVCEVLAGLLFWVIDPPTRSPEDETSAAEPVATAKGGWMSWDLAFLFLVSGGTMAALIGTDLSIVAEMRHLDSVGAIGVVYFFWAVASLVGGLVYGARERPVRPTYLVLTLGLLTIPIGLGTSVWTLAIASVPAGLFCAPSLTAASEWVAKLVPERQRGEAMGWHGTSFTVGGAISSPIIGAGIDGVGPWGGFAIGGAIASAVALLSLAGQAAHRPRVRQEAAS